MSQDSSGQKIERRTTAAAWARTLIGQIGLAAGVAVAYFFAAQLSLGLLTKPDGVAVFWPAAGISSGVLIALGPGAAPHGVIAWPDGAAWVPKAGRTRSPALTRRLAR